MRAFAVYSLVLCVVAVAGCGVALHGDNIGDTGVLLVGLAIEFGAIALLVLGIFVYGLYLIIEEAELR